MKKTLILMVAVMITMAFSNATKPIIEKFKVFGNCPQCKERIENALDVKGIKSADWNIDSKMLEVVFNPEKMNVQKIHELIAASGHDTEKVKSDSLVYSGLPNCCKYRDNDYTHHD